IIVKSKSGTGKTLVYSIIGLETVDVKKNQTQVLILAPTREIAVQTQGVLTSIGRDFKGLKVESFIGGLPLAEDKEKCKSCHIAVGAPGRVKHLIADGILKPHSIRLLVFDEVDKLMESSFLSDINDIFNSLPDRKQVITTSATYPNELNTFLCKYMLSPTFIEVENDTPLLLGLKQYVKTTKPYTNAVQEIQCKNEEILKLLRDVSFVQCLIFTNYQTRAESISNFLNQKRDRLSKNLLTQAPETNLYYKNKALLYVTQILSGVKDSKPDLDSLQYYLKNIKDYDKQVIYKIMDDTKSKSVTELLKNIDKFGQCGGTFSSDSERVSNIENIFEAGYRYATKSNSKHWSLYLPDSEFDRLNHLNETKLEDDACEENDASEVNDNCGILSDDMIFPGTDANEASAPEVLQWVPVNNEVASNPNWEHLASYFNQCSDHLWQNGLSFQSVEDFDNWFYGDWHAQVVAIRNYVQQNIYIREMSDYQRTIFNNNQK
ncbi:hypothetical protein NQ315_000530, partial [Exocentrus adspersus]